MTTENIPVKTDSIIESKEPEENNAEKKESELNQSEREKVFDPLKDNKTNGFFDDFSKVSVALETKNFCKLFLQIVFFWAISELGQLITKFFSFSIPGSLVGVCLLFVLLLLGIVKAHWLEFGSSVITRHMSLFFIPITVGIMGYTELFKSSGLSIFSTLLISACIGIVACGLSIKFSQSLKNKKEIFSSESVK